MLAIEQGQILLLLKRWAEEDQMQVEVFCEVLKKRDGTLYKAIVGRSGIGRRVPHNGLRKRAMDNSVNTTVSDMQRTRPGNVKDLHS